MIFLKITDLKKEEIKNLLRSSSALKEKRKKKKTHHKLDDTNIGLFFETPSTRTRISFSVGISELGGNSIFMDQNQLQLARGEGLKDTGRVLSKYLDAVAIRALDHQKIKELAKNSKIPIINAMTKKYHPCQALADLQTIQEYKKDLKNLKFGWIGDGNNVCHSNILANSLMNIKTSVATPKGYEPDEEIIQKAKELGGELKISNEPKEVAKDADVLYTDVWFSTGEKENKSKIKDFSGFKITNELVEIAENDVIIMHCMPIKGREIERELVDSQHSVIYEQAENRLHTEKALLIKLLEK
ncbi:ornithine carbamoyltransferase [archaeon SCG-AAA382B04]|nr:ornithine carbamoyltransferase [archaeon SCG-AAA382B04]